MNFSNSENESPPLELLYQLLGHYRNGQLMDAEQLSLEIIKNSRSINLPGKFWVDY